MEFDEQASLWWLYIHHNPLQQKWWWFFHLLDKVNNVGAPSDLGVKWGFEMFFSTALLYAKFNPRRSEPCSKKTRGPLLSMGNPGCLIWDPFNGSLCSPYNWTVKSPIYPKQPIFSILKGSLLLSQAESVHAIVLGPLATTFSSFYSLAEISTKR